MSNLLLTGDMPEMAEAMFARSSFCSMCKVTWSYPWSSLSSKQTEALTSTFHCSQDMDLATLRQQILSSNKTANEKAEDLLLEHRVNDLSKDEWRQLIAGIPEDVKKEIGRLKAAGTQLHLHSTWLMYS